MATRLTEAPPSNVTDETRRSFLQKAISAKQDAETYHAIYTNVLKQAKKAGLNTKAMVHAMGDKKRDVADVITDIRDHVRMLACLNMPVTQEEMFPTAGPAAPEASGAAGDDAAWYASQAGYDAGRAGRKIDECPHTPGAEEDAAWRKGWHRGQEHLVLATMPGSKAANDTRKRGAVGPRGARVPGGMHVDTPEDVAAAVAEDDGGTFH